MARVIDALSLANDKKRLPTEAFFVDTNIVILYKDPFSRSTSKSESKRYEAVQKAFHYLKSSNRYTIYAPLVVALEYFKHVQTGYYMTQVEYARSFDSQNFKNLRSTDESFRGGWELHLKKFKQTFTKSIDLHLGASTNELLASFNGLDVDFADHTLYDCLKAHMKDSPCVFSDDKDFYSYPDDLYLLTTNPSVISLAESEGKLFVPSST